MCVYCVCVERLRLCCVLGDDGASCHTCMRQRRRQINEQHERKLARRRWSGRRLHRSAVRHRHTVRPCLSVCASVRVRVQNSEALSQKRLSRSVSHPCRPSLSLRRCIFHQIQTPSHRVFAVSPSFPLLPPSSSPPSALPHLLRSLPHPPRPLLLFLLVTL